MLPIVGFLSLVGLVVLAARSYRHQTPVPRHEAVRRVLYHIARRSIRELSEGEPAVVCGTAIATADPLIAPLSGRPCIGYHLRILRFDGHVIVDHAPCGPFVVADDTGEVGVRADGLELAATDAPIGIAYPPLPPEIQRWVPVATPRLPTYVTEGLLLPGATVTVCGVLHPVIAAGGLYREHQIHYELTATPTFPLVASPDADLSIPSRRPIRPEDLPR